MSLEWMHPPQNYDNASPKAAAFSAQRPRAMPEFSNTYGTDSIADRRINNRPRRPPSSNNTYGADAIAKASLEPLEVWENPEARYGYLIHLEHPEFTSLCPRSGYPDSGTIVIDYIPDEYTVELKAIKLYINSFRNKAISHEAVTNMIADKLMKDADPIALRVIGDFMRRGGVKTVVTVMRGNEIEFSKFAPYQAGIL